VGVGVWVFVCAARLILRLAGFCGTARNKEILTVKEENKRERERERKRYIKSES